MSRLKIKEALELRGMNQSEVARRLGVSPSTVNKWVNGTREPYAGHLLELADMLRVDIDYLYGRTDDPTPPGHDKFDPNREDWREHPDCPQLLRELDQDPDFGEYLENPRTRSILTGIAFHRGDPHKEALLKFLEYALFIEEKEERRRK